MFSPPHHLADLGRHTRLLLHIWESTSLRRNAKQCLRMSEGKERKGNGNAADPGPNHVVPATVGPGSPGQTLPWCPGLSCYPSWGRPEDRGRDWERLHPLGCRDPAPPGPAQPRAAQTVAASVGSRSWPREVLHNTHHTQRQSSGN